MNVKKDLNILNQSLEEIMSDRFGRYSKYIIQGRALPDVRDGLKPVQRRIIYAMNELGLFNEKAFKKSARIVGEVIGKYHPHGDSSIYEAMVRMSQEWKMNEPLIEMHGNKGSIDDDPAAAMRYTETRLSKITKELLIGIKKNTVNFAPNFDDSEKEPTVLPALVPNLLVNGSKGIASGYATEMPPHNLNEIIDAIICKIKSPNARLETLLKYVKGPDFPTGGEIQGQKGIIDAFSSGKGKIIIRSKYKVNDSKTSPYIEITEIPFGVIKSKLVREIDEKRFNNLVSGIKNVSDETDRNGISIRIELNPKTVVKPILNYLLSKTDMQIYFNYNNIGIVNRMPKLLSLSELIDAYIKHQKEVQIASIEYDLSKNKNKLEIIEGLIKVSQNTKKIIDAIRNAEGSKQGVIKKLMEEFSFTKIQANAIADLKLYRLSKTDQNIYLNEKKELVIKIEKANKLLNNENEFNNHLILLLRNLKKKYGSKRKTLITSEIEKIEVNMNELIKHEDVWIGLSKKGYLKRISNRSYEFNKIYKYSLKEEDKIVYFHKVNTSDKLLIFTSKGNFLTIPVHKIDDNKWKEIGKHINDFVNIGVDEEIIDAISVNDFSLKINLVLVTKNGKVKRVKLKDFEVSRFKKSLIAIKLDPNDELVAVKPSTKNKNLIVITNKGKAVKYNQNKINVQSLKSKGMKGIILPKKTYVSAMVLANEEDVIGMISKRGGAKRIKAKNINSSLRDTEGNFIFPAIKSRPHIVIDAKIVKPNILIKFINKNNELKTFQFKEVLITTINEGFSIINSIKNVVDGSILSFNRIHKDSKLFEEVKEIPKKTPVKPTKISIDDILKKI